jgi:hypothetical protein
MTCTGQLPLKQQCVAKKVGAVTGKTEWNTAMHRGIHRDGSRHMRHVRVNAPNATAAKPAGKRYP